MTASSSPRERRTKAELAAEIDRLQGEISQMSQKMDKKMKESRVTMTVRLPISLRDSIRSAAAEEDLSIQDIFEEALTRWVSACNRSRR